MATCWGICSAGKISHDFVVGLKSLLESEHRVVAIGTRDSIDSAKNFASKHTIPKAYGSYQELADDDEVDVVYIGNVHTHHRQVVMMMFTAGKAVLCEKPLTCAAQETAELIRAAKENNVFFMEAIWTRFLPAVVEMRKRISDGEIGDVKYIYASIGVSRPVIMNRLVDPVLGGGALLSLGVYPINIATMIFGEPVSVSASGWLLSTGVDHTAAITLKYSGERVAQLLCSLDLETPGDAVIVGTQGTLKLHKPFYCASKLETTTGIVEYPFPSSSMPTNYPNSVGLRYEAMEVRDCLLRGSIESDIMSLKHSQIVANVVDCVMKELT